MKKKQFWLFIFLMGLGFSSIAQEAKQDPNKDIWYVWVDTYAKVDGVETRIVSKEVTKINCCVKSPKYRRLLKSTVKWIRKNVDDSYKGQPVPLSKIQDQSLADLSHEKAKNTENVHLIDYSQACN